MSLVDSRSLFSIWFVTFKFFLNVSAESKSFEALDLFTVQLLFALST